MTYDQAMEEVKKSHVEAAATAYRCVVRQAARRLAWAADADTCTQAVIYREEFVREVDAHEDAYEWQFFLNQFTSASPTEWGTDVNAIPWWASDEDVAATDWELHELWS
jgi:hypothetical protein